MNAEIDVTGVVLKTERLTLRPFRETDLQDFFEYASVEGVGEMSGWIHHKNIQDSKAILEIFLSEKKTFAIELDGKVIGSVGIEKYNEEVLPELNDKLGREIGFVLSKDYWGRGIMPEAVKAVIEYLLNDLHHDFVVCGHFAGNTQSKRVQEKCGFKPYKMSKYKTEYGEIKDNCINIIFLGLE
ncbi:MAG: GNAT family N-acetyltransferase [Ruminococcus sp.]|nr:GNAT family N-acetyltransferase [Ruminococcus sp.]